MFFIDLDTPLKCLGEVSLLHNIIFGIWYLPRFYSTAEGYPCKTHHSRSFSRDPPHLTLSQWRNDVPQGAPS